jgi:hypothetical protein
VGGLCNIHFSESVSFSQIEKDFKESLGYIRQDIKAVHSGHNTLNYTLALLIGCGCEMLAVAEGDWRHRRGEEVFQHFLSGDWKLLADRLYTMLRDGLAHSFDTKLLVADGRHIQVFVAWSQVEVIRLGTYRWTEDAPVALGVWIGMKGLASALCARIDDFEAALRSDEHVRQTYRAARAYDSTAQFTVTELQVWDRLVEASGVQHEQG